MSGIGLTKSPFKVEIGCHSANTWKRCILFSVFCLHWFHKPCCRNGQRCVSWPTIPCGECKPWGVVQHSAGLHHVRSRFGPHGHELHLSLISSGFYCSNSVKVKSYWSVYACTFVTWHVSQNLHGHQHRQDLPKEDSASTSCRAIKGGRHYPISCPQSAEFRYFFCQTYWFCIEIWCECLLMSFNYSMSCWAKTVSDNRAASQTIYESDETHAQLRQQQPASHTGVRQRTHES